MQAELIYIWDSVFGMSWHGKDANNYVQNAHFKYRWSQVSKAATVAGSSGTLQGKALCIVALEKQNLQTVPPDDWHKWPGIYKA